MLQTLKLLLPAIIPSWRFFDIIAPAPSIEYALLQTQDTVPVWHEFRPRPENVTAPTMFKRLFWNPYWNETLFLVSCAERLLEEPTPHSSNEIIARIKADLKPNSPYLQFRLVLRHRENTEIAYISQVYPT